MNYTYINFEKLPNKDFDGFNKRVADAAACITLEDSIQLQHAYKEHIANFHVYMENAAVNNAVTLAKDTNAARIGAFVYFRGTVRHLLKYPAATDAALAAELWQYVEQFGDADSLTQNVLTGVIQNTIKETEARLENEAYAKASASDGLKACFDVLKETEAAYEAADLGRANNRANRLQETRDSHRDACVKDYKNLVNYALTMVALKSDAGCVEFLGKVGDIVKFTRSLYISRAKQRAEEREEAKKAANAGETADVKAESTDVETSATPEAVNNEVAA